MRPLAALFLVAALAVPAQAASIEIRAGTLVVDSAAGTIVASGGVVVTDGRATIRAPRAVVSRSLGTATFEGGVVVTFPGGTLEAATVRARLASFRAIERASAQAATLRLRAGTLRAGTLRAADVTVWPDQGEATATGAPTLLGARGFVLTGRVMRYDLRTRRVSVTGSATVRSSDAVVTGDRLDGDPAAEIATLRGRVRGTFGAIRGTARAATINARDRVAILEGDVALQRPDGTLWASRVTIYYGAGKVVAEGVTRIVIEEKP